MVLLVRGNTMPAYKDPKTGKWFCKFRYKNWQDNTVYKTKRGFSTKREAIEWETSFKLEVSGENNMPFSRFVEIYKSDRFPRLKESTRETKENIIDSHILPYFKNKKLNEIESRDIISWQNILLKYKDCNGKPYAMSYLKTIHNQLSAIFNHAIRFYDLKSNPASIVGNIGNTNEIKMNFWTLEEYKKFSDEMMEKPVFYYAFQVLYWSGIRLGEMLALTKEDIDLESKTISIDKTYQVVNKKELVTSPKTAKSNRTIIIPNFLVEEIKDFYEMLPPMETTQRIFCMVSKSSLHRNIKRGAEKASLKPIRVHDLRHSHVSLLIDMGFSAVSIADRVGHESINITFKYAHLFPKTQMEMAEQLNGLMED